MRVLVTGWPSFRHGEATAGDVLAMEAVQAALADAGVECHLAWSPVFRPGALDLERADPAFYTHLVFACGPLHGRQIEELHRRYARCTRVAVGVSVIDPDDPAVTGFDAVLARDAPVEAPRQDLAALPATPSVPVAGVVLAPGQAEYGGRRRHARVEHELTDWLAGRGCARLPLDTRLDPRDWRLFTTAAELESVLRRLDVVVTTRLHGLVLALKSGVPVLAVDPVGGGAKVAAQARAWSWPAVVTVPAPSREGRDEPVLDLAELDRWWTWCLSPDGGGRAVAQPADGAMLGELMDVLGAR
ncbi:polysaccharide pyruvyl transferase family protein [Actinomadura darangshiensis]|uniref:Polysaccharide pyruvyl transferase family protein n=1 Tax=Actinomadura darangshiensis TaxID=705336 RepID=A0A4V2YXE0_9ACTN|nr:polysaccharide pyruvyl transferase family protein [Actinomadura darangshiensis]TDD88687.1 polysaccharide pyruvyl transferase family protein [Actinomadura darangshiensis]